MRALTLKPHWAHAVAHLGKRIENRKKPIPNELLGQRIAIHAGATLPTGWFFDMIDAAPIRLTGEDGRPPYVGPRSDPTTARPVLTRHIVATAVLAGQDPAWPESADSECGAPPSWAIRPPPPGEKGVRFWWHLEDVRRLVEPVPFPKPLRGQLGLWHLDKVREGLSAEVESAAWEA